jgi:ferric iron reductase protein FhuF
VPTILTIGPFRFFFSSSDGSEPPHIHVELEGRVAKFWLQPVELSNGGRLPGHELRRIEKLVTEHQVKFVQAWNDYFSR